MHEEDKKSFGSVTTTGCVCLRENPILDAPILAFLEPNTELILIQQYDTYNDFVNVKTSNGLDGFCHKDYLSFDNSDEFKKKEVLGNGDEPTRE